MTFRQAIRTKYVGPTDTRGSRIRVTCDCKSKFYAWDDALNGAENHYRAAMRLFKELGWDAPNKKEKGTLVGGSIGNIYYFVTVEQVGSGLLRAWE